MRLLKRLQSPCLLFTLLSVLVTPARGEDWRNLVQPLGTLVSVQTAATVNALLGGKPPFDTATDVTTINTSRPQYFVRFYNPTDPAYPSNAIGSWIMRAGAVRGLTPAQVRDLFALPAMPTHMVIVLAPSGSNMYTGIAGPIAGWGAGSGQQSKLIGPPWVPSGNFLNQQPIMANILSYRLLAPGDNPGRIAAYLDGRIPAPYSDLETAYLNLDLLYTGAQANQFRSALDQIGPARYDHLTLSALSAGVLFNDAIDQRVDLLFLGSPPGMGSRTPGRSPLPAEADPNGGQGNRVWGQAVGGLQRAAGLGFNAASGGIVAGADRQIGDRTLAGVSLGVLRSSLDWTGPGGSATLDRAALGGYAAWMPRDFLVQLGLTAGVSQGDASRRIEFSTLTRSAASQLFGWDLNSRLRLGYRLPLEALEVVPTAGIDYFYHRRNSFTEVGADSLDLCVAAADNHTLRSRVGVTLSKVVAAGNAGTLAPSLQIGWAREVYLDERALTARLSGQPDDFTVYGKGTTADILTLGAGVTYASGPGFSVSLHYGLEYRQGLTQQTLAAAVEYRF